MALHPMRNTIEARETHKQSESGQSGSKVDEWEQVKDAKRRCRLVYLATRDANYSLGEYSRTVPG